ncbi:seipin-2-like [Coffea arabica]|uniref:Seipin-2-like n=1 Tax=Coffea arabica TaxID=13443 RepID=A0A6P6S6A8_COFAR|nr:seipin-2-like [Coffea arabica]
MDDSNIQENIDDIDGNHGTFKGPSDSFGYVNERGRESDNFFINLMRHSLLLGAEKLLMARKSPGPFLSSQLESCSINEDKNDLVRKWKGKGAMQLDEKVRWKSECSPLQSSSSSSSSNPGIESSNMYVQFPKMIECPSSFYNNFPLDFVAFLRILTVLILELGGAQLSLFTSVFTLPIQIFNFWLTMLTLPFRALALTREHLMKKLLTLRSYFWFSLMYFICDRLKLQQSMLKVAVRFCWAFFWSVYVYLILVGLLIMGFVIGGITMRHLVVESIQTTENLNFDYTTSSPVAFVPVTSSPVTGASPGLISEDRMLFSKSAGGRTIPYNHKLQLTVLLTMPESEYNRNLGIFQVRVECLSSEGKVTASSSYPTMLQFKSQPIRFVGTIFKSPLLLAGFQSEIQHLKIGVMDFTEGYEPTACFKVIIEQRAEYEAGFGIPEIYAASLHIESELPQIKRMIWYWRRSVFVWISIITFLTELIIALIFCRPVIFPGRSTIKVVGARSKVSHGIKAFEPLAVSERSTTTTTTSC